jgi:hypothetical protein
MEKAAVLLLVSRGLVECGLDQDQSPDEFGMERVKQLVLNSTQREAQALCTYILQAASDFSPAAALCDDRTALALVRTA